jgi:hypothetical protein
MVFKPYYQQQTDNGGFLIHSTMVFRQIRLGTQEKEIKGETTTREGLFGKTDFSNERIDETEPLLIPKLEEDYGTTGQNGKPQRKEGRWSAKRFLHMN